MGPHGALLELTESLSRLAAIAFESTANRSISHPYAPCRTASRPCLAQERFQLVRSRPEAKSAPSEIAKLAGFSLHSPCRLLVALCPVKSSCIRRAITECDRNWADKGFVSKT